MNYCHPHSKLNCVKCQKDFERKCEFGIFVWRGDGNYRREDALDGKLYKHKGVAERLCNKLNETDEAKALPGGGYVVRSFLKSPQ